MLFNIFVATANDYKLTGFLEAYENKTRIFVRNWGYSIPRKMGE